MMNWQRLVWFLATVGIAAAIFAAATATADEYQRHALITTTQEEQGVLPGPPRPGGGGPPAPTHTAVPTATNTPIPTATPNPYSWVGELPSPGVASNHTYTAYVVQCVEGPPGGGGVCLPFTWSYFETIIVQAEPIDPCCMGALVSQDGWLAAISNGTGPWVPDIHVSGVIFNWLKQQVAGVTLTKEDAQNCPFTGPGYEATVSGCVDFIPPLAIDGANEIDYLTVDPGADSIPVSGYAQQIAHKFY